MKWPMINLPEICRPRQWKTLSKKEMSSDGYPVYGANGRIGFSDTYPHEKPVILIGCRGTCGSVHVTEPKSYANGNAMALDNLDERRVSLQFLASVLKGADFSKVITGVAQPQITGQSLARFKIPLPPLAEQKRIAAILDAADALRAKRREALAQLDTLLQSSFLTLFGDPVTNPMGWEVLELGKLGQITTGKTPPTKNQGMFGGEIPFATPGDLNDGLRSTARTITTSGAKFTKIVRAGSALVGCIGNIGKMAKSPRATAFNQQINAVEWSERIHDSFGINALVYCIPQMHAKASKTIVPILNKSGFSSVAMIAPPTPPPTKIRRHRRIHRAPEDHAARPPRRAGRPLRRPPAPRVSLGTLNRHGKVNHKRE